MSTREQITESQKVCDAATNCIVHLEYETSEQPPYEHYPYALIGPTNQGVLEAEISQEYKDQYGHEITEIAGISEPDAQRLVHSWNELPLRNAQLAAVLELADKLDAQADDKSRSLDMRIERAHYAKRIRRAIEDAAP